MDEERTEIRRRRSWIVTCITCLLIGLVSYVLSIGPISWMERKGMLPESGPAYEALVLLYTPIATIFEWKIEPFHSALDTYVNWWIS